MWTRKLILWTPFAVAGAPFLLGEGGLNRYTTLDRSWMSIVLIFVAAFGMVFYLGLRSLLDPEGEVRWIVTRQLSVLQRWQRLGRVGTLLVLGFLMCGFWSWYTTGLLAQYFPGSKSILIGTVTGARPDLAGRQRCKADFDLQVSSKRTITICYQAGYFLPSPRLSPNLPAVGQRIRLKVATNWFGSVAEGLVPLAAP